MRRLPTIIGAGLVAAATASAIAVTSGSAQAPGERTLTFVERETNTFVLADVPPLAGKHGGPSKGDTILFKNTVLDSTGATKLGSFEARCTFLRATKQIDGSRAICDAAYTLGDGMITASVATTFTNKVTFAVTGGTGAYEGARGSGTNISRPGNNNSLSDTVIHLLP
jgi:allene oxide cyclase